MASSFETLGNGNGFPFCLERKDAITDQVIQNVPTLAQAMSAYWNIDSISFGGATFNPTNEPKDLICNPDANVPLKVYEAQDSQEEKTILNRGWICVGTAW